MNCINIQTLLFNMQNNNTNIFIKWLKITSQFNPVNDDDKYSHLLLNGIGGGKLYIKNENMNIFYEKYCEGIKNNEYIYAVESRRTIFPLFFDLDYLLDIEFWENEKDEYKTFFEIFNHIYQTIELFYDFSFKCIITEAEIKYITKPEKEEKNIKKGFHIHFPEILVNTEIALKIRKMCISKLKMVYGNKFANSFSDILDETVFVKNGLRLTGSRKGCFETVNGKKEFVDQGRPYELLYVITKSKIDNEATNQIKNDLLSQIKMTSIITGNDAILTEQKELKLDISDEACYNCDDSEENSDEENTKNVDNIHWNKLSKDDTRYSAIIRFFDTYAKKYNYYSKDIKRIFYSDNKQIYIIWTKSKYCLNIGREHKSCGTYFKLTNNGLVQKCFCKCDTQDGRKWGYCHSFSSCKAGIEIPSTVHINKILEFKDNKKNFSTNDTDFSSFSLKPNHFGTSTSLTDMRDLLYCSFTNDKSKIDKFKKAKPQSRSHEKSQAKPLSTDNKIKND